MYTRYADDWDDVTPSPNSRLTILHYVRNQPNYYLYNGVAYVLVWWATN